MYLAKQIRMIPLIDLYNHALPFLAYVTVNHPQQIYSETENAVS